MPVRSIYLWLALAVAIFLALALAYARATPAWQAPDEPAHYNYVAYLATTGQLPILQPGDYPDGKVPIGPEVRLSDISAFRYEAHQPPLFYALEAVVFKLHPSVFALRALSLLLGAALLPVAFLCARVALPAKPWLWLAVAAFAGFVPMHLFVAGSVENDSLADLVLSLVLLAYLASWPSAILGLLLGLAALTKVTIYLPAILLGLATLLLVRKIPSPAAAGEGEGEGAQLQARLGRLLLGAALAASVAAAVSGWWFIRNGLIYGWADVFVQNRQAQVAGSQTQTGALGAAQLWNFIAAGFHSFWGQFGWMSIPLPERDYRVLIAFTGVCAAGWVVFACRRLSSLTLPSPAAAGEGWRSLGFGLTWAGTAGGLLIYNLKFVQPQGRYLFPALVPIGVFYVCGFAALFPRRVQPAAVAALSLGLIVFAAYTLRHDLIPAFR
jgi:hypothetical protein